MPKSDLLEKQYKKSREITKDLLGYVPTEEEWLGAYEEEPGLVNFFLHVINRKYDERHSYKEDYTPRKLTKVKDAEEKVDIVNELVYPIYTAAKKIVKGGKSE